MHGTSRRLAAGLSGLLVLALTAGCTGGGGESYQTVCPEPGSVERTVEDTGTVSYRESYSVTPLASGSILTCAIAEGDTVEAGQVLYTIDSGDLEDQITQARLSLSSAQAALEQAQAACEDLSVKAHASGTVTTVYVHEGDYVSTGTPVADLVDSVNLTLTLPFSVEDAAAIHSGDAALVSFPSHGDTLTGSVKRVYEGSTVLSGGREGVYVEISLTNPGAISSGSAATASVGAAVCMEAGTVSYATQQSIYASQSGQVSSLPIQVGSAVSDGQVVMTLKNDSLTNAVTNARLSVSSASVSLEQLIAKRGDYSVTAPVDGVVLTRISKTGDFAAAATPLATLARPEDLCVKVDIDELYIDQVEPGQSATVTFTSESGQERSYSGTVRRIDDAGTVSGGVTDYTVELELEDLEGLRDGMNVSVSILIARGDGGLRIPASALQGDTVQVLRDGKAVEVSVTVGVVGNEYAEILSGLTTSDEVIVP